MIALEPYLKRTSVFTILRQYELSKVIDVLAIGFFANPRVVGKGILVGVGNWVINGALLSSLTYYGFDRHVYLQKKKFSLHQTQEDWISIRFHTIIFPVIEELIFRVVIQRTTKEFVQLCFWGAHKMKLEGCGISFDDDSIKIKDYKITAQHVAIFVSSLSFTFFHNYSPIFLLNIFISGVIYGKLADSEGVICPITAHIVNNSCVQLVIEIFS